jgi:hypothetical protein
VGLLLLEIFGLCFALPMVLARFRRSKVVLSAQIILIGVLAVLAVLRFEDSREITSALEKRDYYKLPSDSLGRLSLSINPLPHIEAIQVSVLDFPSGSKPSMELVKSITWELEEHGNGGVHNALWFQEAGERIPDPDDGIPLFEIEDRPLKGPVTLRYEVTSKNQDLIRSIRLRVRPDWFSRKMLPPIAGLQMIRGIFCLVGIAISLAGAIKIPSPPPQR